MRWMMIKDPEGDFPSFDFPRLATLLFDLVAAWLPRYDLDDGSPKTRMF